MTHLDPALVKLHLLLEQLNHGAGPHSHDHKIRIQHLPVLQLHRFHLPRETQSKGSPCHCLSPQHDTLEHDY